MNAEEARKLSEKGYDDMVNCEVEHVLDWIRMTAERGGRKIKIFSKYSKSQDVIDYITGCNYKIRVPWFIYDWIVEW